jgi:hypothetical protein
MKTSHSLCFLVVLYFMLGSTTFSNTYARSSSNLQAHLTALITALPVPFLNLSISKGYVAIELRYGPRWTGNTATVQPVTLSLTFRRSGRAEFLFRSRHLRLAFPYRGA